MIISRIFLVIAVALTLEGFACQTTHATLIVGLLNIGGSAPGPFGASNGLGFDDVKVGAGENGSFSNLNGAPVAIASPSMFLGPSSGAYSLWSVGGFTLDLVFGKREDQTTISGTATIFVPGSSPTFGAQWKYTSLIGGRFTFRLTSTTLVTPDSGTTMVLLGFGLVAIAGFRARFAIS